jgi:hypothetical protein
MSSGTAARAVSRAGSVAAGLAWTALAGAVALGAAGLAGQTIHPPGGPAREEITYTGDHALQLRLDAAAASLQGINDNVDRMAAAAKSALGSVSEVDPTDLKTYLERGNGAAVLIAAAALDLRTSLTSLPGDGPDAVVQYSNPTLVRRAQILAAMDAALSLAQDWDNVTGRSLDAARAAGLLNQHEQTVFDASQLGTKAQYDNAISLLEQAKVTLEDIASLRDQIVAGGDVTVLDDWIQRHQKYDAALEALYKALLASHGRNTLVVQQASRDEQAARQQLPPNGGAIVVIVAQLAQGGLNQAVLAINDAQGRIEAALAEPGAD